jgi:ABC-type antimicrobial peptide transport system permease subunit
MLTIILFAWKDMRHDWTRTLLGMVGLAVIIFSYQILTSLVATFGGFLNAPGTSRNLVVIQSEFIDPSEAVLDPVALDAVRSLGSDLVSRVSPSMFRYMRVNDHLLQVRAAALQDWQGIYHLELMNGRWPKGDGEIIVGEGIAQSNQWFIGSSVEIYGSSFRVVGIFRSPGASIASIWMPIDQAGRLFGQDRLYQMMYVQVNEEADLEEVRSRLQNDPRLASRYAIFYEDSYTYRNNQFMKDFQKLMRIAGGLALLAVSFGTFNMTNLSLVERAREIGILRAIGFSHRIIINFLLLKALLQGVLAYLAGLLAAWGYVIYQQTGARSYILGIPLTFEISASQILSGMLWTCILVILGVWLSTKQLMSLSVVDLFKE